MKKTITIATHEKRGLKIPAIVRGNLALHCAYAAPSNQSLVVWSISHIPTGKALASFYSALHARKLLRALQSLGDWDFTDQRTWETMYWRAAFVAIREIYWKE